MQFKVSVHLFAVLLIVICQMFVGNISPAYAGDSTMLKLVVSECGADFGEWLDDAKVRVEVVAHDFIADEHFGITDDKGYVEFDIEGFGRGDKVYVYITAKDRTEAYSFVHVYEFVDPGPKRTGAWSIGSAGGGGSHMNGPCSDHWYDESAGIIHAVAKEDLPD